MHNFFTLILQICICCSFSLLALKIGEKALNAWLCLVAVAMNLFVTKQVCLCGLDVTAADPLAVGYLLGLSLIQEYYGKGAARKHVVVSIVVSIGFLFLSSAHLLFIPNQFDTMHPVFTALLNPMPRLIGASLLSFALIQLVDIAFFQYLRSKAKGKWFTGRTGVCLVMSQALDTVVFSYLGLWGLVENLVDIMIVSFTFKILVTFLSLPFVTLSGRLLNKKPHRGVGNIVNAQPIVDHYLT